MTAGRLAGHRALITRPRERAQELCFLLEDEGAEVIALPLLELQPPEDPRPLRAAAERVGRFQWIALCSPSAVAALVEAVREAGTFPELRRAHLAAVGPATARAVRAHGLDVDRQVEQGGGAALFEALRPDLRPGDQVLLPAAAEGRPELEAALRDAGAEVTRVCAYRSVKQGLPAEAMELLRRAPPTLALFGSPRTAEALLEALGEQEARALLAGAKLVAIGPTTRAAIESLGFTVAGTAVRPTAEALVDAAAEAAQAP